MQIDGRALARAATRVDGALRHVDAVQQVDAPLLGYGSAHDAVQGGLADARDSSMSVVDELSRAGTPGADGTRLAVEQLASDNVAPRIAHPSIDGVPLADRVRSGEVVDPQLHRMQVGFLHETAVRGVVEEMLAAPPTADVAHRVAAFAELHADAVFGSTGRAAWRDKLRAGLAAASDEDEASLLLDTLALHRAAPDPAALEKEARALLAERTLDPTTFRRLAVIAGQSEGVQPALLDGLVDEFARAIRSSESTTTIDDARWPLERDAIVADPAGRLVALGRVEEILGRPVDELTRADLRRVQRFSTLPEPVRPDLDPGSLPYTLDEVVDGGWLPAGDADARELVKELRFRVARQRLELDPVTTREGLVRELEAMLSKTDEQVTETDLRRLALIDAMPPALRPELPPDATRYSRRGISDARWLPTTDADSKAEFASLRRWKEVRHVIEDPSVTRESLAAEIEAIIAKPDDRITAQDVQRLAFVDELPGVKRPELPAAATRYSRRRIADSGWLPSDDRDTKMEFASLRLWRDQIAAAADTTMTRARATADLDAVLAKADDQFTADDMRRIAIIDELPADRRPAMPPTEGLSRSEMYLRGLLPASDRDALVELANMRWWKEAQAALDDASVTRASLFGELDAILAKSDDQVTAVDLGRVAMLEMVGGEKSLGFPPAATQYSRRRIAVGLPDNDAYAQADFSMLRSWRTSDRIMEDPAVRRETLAAELRRMLAKPDEQITVDDLRWLAVVDGLPAAKRPELPPAKTFPRQRIADEEWLPSSDSYARTEFDSLRLWLDQRDFLADPANTSDRLRDRVVRIALKNHSDVTVDDLRTLAMAEALPSDRTPWSLPPRATPLYSRRRIWHDRLLPSEDSGARAELESLRTWAIAQTPEGWAAAAERIRNGDMLDARTIEGLTASGHEALAGAGIALDDVLRSARGMITAAEADVMEVAPLREGMLLTRQLLDASSTHITRELRPVAAEAVRLLQRNIDRIDGTLGGGYSNYPDYAEVARAATNVDLLLAARAAASPSPPATTATSSARTGADTLTW